MIKDISYKDYKRTNDIHGAVLYPAVMIPPAQNAILSEYLSANETKRIIDPFHGSGIALYEASEIAKNVSVTGIDINPLANLITTVKLQGVTDRIEKDIDIIKRKLRYTKDVRLHSFPNIDKWFQSDIIHSLSCVRNAIMSTKNKKSRMFFWCMLIDIVRKYSNSRSSTYKLHIKEKGQIDRQKNMLIENYISSIEKYYLFFPKSEKDYQLYKGDSIKLLKEMEDNDFDICITSPPYGENATTVPYGQYSMLALYWIDSKDLCLEGWEFDNYSTIDARSIGGPQSSIEEAMEIPEISEIISKISVGKQRKVRRFFSGYFAFLDEMIRVTKERAIITLGNRTVDSVNINLTDITVDYLQQRGFVLDEKLSREILSKRTPKVVSRVNGVPVSSMNEEYVVILHKQKSENVVN